MPPTRWIEIAALGGLAGIFAIMPIYAPQGIDLFAIAFFLLGSLLIDQRDIDAADWTGRRPFIFACAVVVLAIPLVSGVFSYNGFRSHVGSGVYIAAAPPALFLVAAKARFRLIGPLGIERLILIAVFVGLIPATVYALITTDAPFHPLFVPGLKAPNIAAVYFSCISTITLNLNANRGRRARILGYAAIVVALAVGLMTESRMFLVTTAIILGFYVFAIRHRKVLLREMTAVAGVIGAVLVASLFAFYGSLTRLFTPQPLGFFDGRLQTWADGWELFRRYPLFGIGPNTFHSRLLNPLYKQWDQQGVPFIPFYHAHNIFLNTLAEGGILVGVLLLALIAAALYGCHKTLKDDPQNPFGQIALALLALLLVVGLFEDSLVRPVTFTLAIFLGLGMNVTWTASPHALKPS